MKKAIINIELIEYIELFNSIKDENNSILSSMYCLNMLISNEIYLNKNIEKFSNNVDLILNELNNKIFKLNLHYKYLSFKYKEEKNFFYKKYFKYRYFYFIKNLRENKRNFNYINLNKEKDILELKKQISERIKDLQDDKNNNNIFIII